MVIDNIIVTPLNEQDINVHLKVSEAAVFNYLDFSYEIENNTITLTACYKLELFLTQTTLENDFIISGINNGINNYTLIVIVNYRTNNICSNGTFSDTETLNFNTPVSDSISLANSNFEKVFEDIKVYPNPTSGILNFYSIYNEILNISIFDSLGRKVMDQKRLPNQIIDISNLREGYYLIKINNDNGASIEKLIFKI
jgi:hypothetical protein